jgi:hypothetical protein
MELKKPDAKEITFLQSLPATFGTKQLENLLGTFPNDAIITRHDASITVEHPKAGKVLSAIRASKTAGQWAVSVKPGLLTQV